MITITNLSELTVSQVAKYLLTDDVTLTNGRMLPKGSSHSVVNNAVYSARQKAGIVNTQTVTTPADPNAPAKPAVKTFKMTVCVDGTSVKVEKPGIGWLVMDAYGNYSTNIAGGLALDGFITNCHKNGIAKAVQALTEVDENGKAIDGSWSFAHEGKSYTAPANLDETQARKFILKALIDADIFLAFGDIYVTRPTTKLADWIEALPKPVTAAEVVAAAV